jgi:hypothetical protein
MTTSSDSERAPSGKPGRVRLIVEDTLPGGEPVVEIRDGALKLKRRTRANQYVELDPGLYVVSAALPDGGTPTRAVDVRAGEDQDIDVRADPLRAHAVARATVSPLSRILSFVPLLTRLAGLGQPALYSRVAHAASTGPYLGSESAPRVTDRSKVNDVTHLELSVERPKAISVAQFAVGDEVPTNVVLPLHFAAHDAEADLQVTFDRDGGVDPVAVPTGSPEIELIADYMRTGQVEAAAHVIDRAEYLLREKEMNPVAAALGGYALLRVGETSGMHDWPTNLANRFPWLPDGPVIAGELAAREGDHERAADWFIKALDRGYPMFSDGLSILASRLRYYLHSERTPTAVLGREPDARRLIRMIPFADFSQLAVTFTGLDIDDPEGSQEPLPKRKARAWTALGHG